MTFPKVVIDNLAKEFSVKDLGNFIMFCILVFLLIYGLITVKRFDEKLRILNAKADVLLERSGR